MTINGIGSGNSSFMHSAGALDADGQLALLVLKSEDAQQSAAREGAALARERYAAASEAEVQAMRDAADHLFVGAVLRGVCQLTAAAIQFGDATDSPGVCRDGREKYEAPFCESGAAAATAASEPLAVFFGDSEAKNDEADAKREGTTATLAQSDLSDAKEAIKQSQDRQVSSTDWLASESANRASASSAIIAGFA
jgi:hypothetical protein